nr:hypothetical protein [uncultured Rhodopila sp.]
MAVLILLARIGIRKQPHPRVAAAEAVDGEFPAADHLEQFGIARRRRVQRALPGSVPFDRLAYRADLCFHSRMGP